MNKYIRIIILLSGLAIAVPVNAQSNRPLINRLYLDFGIMGSQITFFKTKIDNGSYRHGHDPSGLVVSGTVGNEKYHIKPQVILNLNSTDITFKVNTALLVGRVYHHRTHMFEVNVGPSYSFFDTDKHIKGDGYAHRLGMQFHAGTQLILFQAIGFNPFIQLDMNSKGIWAGAGVKLGLGKIGYFSKEFERFSESKKDND